MKLKKVFLAAVLPTLAVSLLSGCNNNNNQPSSTPKPQSFVPVDDEDEEIIVQSKLADKIHIGDKTAAEEHRDEDHIHYEVLTEPTISRQCITRDNGKEELICRPHEEKHQRDL